MHVVLVSCGIDSWYCNQTYLQFKNDNVNIVTGLFIYIYNKQIEL